MEQTTTCSCGCGTVVIIGGKPQGRLEDNLVYKLGELAYIELFVEGHKDADNRLHAFSTFMGLPPDIDTAPVCGACLTNAYNERAGKPKCPACERAIAAAKRKTK